MASPPLLPAALGLTGALVAVGWLGWHLRGDPVGVRVLAGEARVERGQLILSPGAIVQLGTGRSVAVSARGDPGLDLDLLRGDPAGSHIFGHVGAVGGLYREDYSLFGQTQPSRVRLGGQPLVSLRCERQLRLTVNQRQLAVEQPPDGCEPQPLSVRAGSAVVLTQYAVDDAAAAPRGQRFAARPAAALGAAIALVSPLLGLAGWAPLLLLPLAAYAPRLGLPILALAWLIGASALFGQAVNNRGWRRILAGLLAAGAVAAAGEAVLPDGPGPAAWQADRAGIAWVDRGFLERKVDESARRLAPYLAAAPGGRPLVVALGSSSSGGETWGRFWPQVLGEQMPEVTVFPLTVGGATTWHLREIFTRLEPRPVACVLYAGNNDRMPAFPGLTIPELLRGQRPRPGEWIAPLSLAESQENVRWLAERCGKMLGMAEHVVDRAPEMAEYDAMLRQVPGVRVADARALLGSLPASAMLDSVHPSPAGQEQLGRFVAGELRELLGLTPATADSDPQAPVGGPR